MILTRLFVIFFLYGNLLAWGQDNKQSASNPSMAYPINPYATSCLVSIAANTTARIQNPALPLNQCEEYKIIAAINNQEFVSNEMVKTSDDKTQCVKDGGFTTDYKDCKRLVTLYDAVLLAEQAMFSAQTIQVNEANKKSEKEVADRTAKGDGQNAAIDAVIARNALNEKIFKTQAATYTAAVASLSAGLIAWKGKKHFIKNCIDSGKYGKASTASTELGKATFTQIECTGIVTKNSTSSKIFRNDSAKTIFMVAVGQFVQKAVEAIKKAGLNEEVGEKLKAMPQMADTDQLVLDPCLIDPLAPCSKVSNKSISSGAFGTGNIVKTDSFTHETIDFSKSNISGLGYVGNVGTDSDYGSTDSIANSNPSFSNDKSSSDSIVDPASAASLASGSGSQLSGASGAGAGGAGGGSASLGDDLEGEAADSTKDTQVKMYESKSSGGKARNDFLGISNRQLSQDEKPISFNDSTRGGIEEAEYQSSIPGEKSPLIFDRISNRYQKVQISNRIQILNNP